jgi:hypothetical protein
LASLHDYDVAHGGTLSTEPAHRYLTVVERSAGNDGLPLSEVAQVADSGPYPRGCALPHFAAHRAGDLKFFSQAAASASKPHHGQWNTRAFAMVVLRTKHN